MKFLKLSTLALSIAMLHSSCSDDAPTINQNSGERQTATSEDEEVVYESGPIGDSIGNASEVFESYSGSANTVLNTLPDQAASSRLQSHGGNAPFKVSGTNCNSLTSQPWFRQFTNVYVDRNDRSVWTCATNEGNILYKSMCNGSSLGLCGTVNANNLPANNGVVVNPGFNNGAVNPGAINPGVINPGFNNGVANPASGLVDNNAINRLQVNGGFNPFIVANNNCNNLVGQPWFSNFTNVYADRNDKSIWTCATADGNKLYKTFCGNSTQGVCGQVNTNVGFNNGTNSGVFDQGASNRLRSNGGYNTFVISNTNCASLQGQSWFTGFTNVYIDRNDKSVWTCGTADGNKMYKSYCSASQGLCAQVR